MFYSLFECKSIKQISLLFLNLRAAIPIIPNTNIARVEGFGTSDISEPANAISLIVLLI